MTCEVFVFTILNLVGVAYHDRTGLGWQMFPQAKVCGFRNPAPSD